MFFIEAFHPVGLLLEFYRWIKTRYRILNTFRSPEIMLTLRLQQAVPSFRPTAERKVRATQSTILPNRKISVRV